MRLMLVLLAFYLIVADTFALDLGPMPGLSIKNAILYLIALFLVFRMALGSGFKLEQRGIHACFVIMIGYAILTYLNAILVADFPRYDAIEAGIKLKNGLIDHFIFFAVFFYGARTSDDAISILKSLLLAVVLANFVTVTDSLGILDLGVIKQRDDGRVEGAIGESNQYAAFISVFLPALAAAVALHKGVWRAVWIGSLLISITALLMTVSRGAFVGLALSAVWSTYLFRRHVSVGRIAAGFAIVVGVVSLIVLAMSIKYGALLEDRLFGQTSSIDMSDASSGRTEIWTAALERMMHTPITFITGFGWNVYWSMPFRFSPHNHYLNMWFNLGLVGLIGGILLLALPIRAAKTAVDRLQAPERTYLMAYVAGALALCGAIFFVDLFQPWWYFWAFTGLMMRIAVSARETAVAPQPVAQPVAANITYGWTATPRP